MGEVSSSWFAELKTKQLVVDGAGGPEDPRVHQWDITTRLVCGTTQPAAVARVIEFPATRATFQCPT